MGKSLIEVRLLWNFCFHDALRHGRSISSY
jgi:hypothetical protein